jgi:hypothetical protein
MADNIEKVEEDSPLRCHGATARGQCINKKMPGSDFCKVHGGVDKVAKESLRNYRLTKWQSRVNDKADQDNIKNLREEIGIMRILMETVINACTDENDLMMASAKIADMVGKIDGLVKSCHKLEGSMGHLLDKQAILQFAGQVIGIISKHIEDVEVLNKIADEITLALGENDEQE